MSELRLTTRSASEVAQRKIRGPVPQRRHRLITVIVKNGWERTFAGWLVNPTPQGHVACTIRDELRFNISAMR
jgi:hypothetical protein